jgi:hypothetical protein
VASCPVLDVFSQGDTEKKATENLAEALSLFLIARVGWGTMEQVSMDNGMLLTSVKHVFTL